MNDQQQWPEGAPGSDEALDKGCRCAVFDNAHGRGIYGMGKNWWITEGCPVHQPSSSSTRSQQ